MDLNNKFNEDRKTFIGGSDAVLLMGGQQNLLWRRKTGQEPEFDGSNILYVQMGLWTEPLNRHWFSKKTGFEVIEPERNEKGELILQRHGFAEFAACNPDGFVLKSPKGPRALFEAKHTGSGSIRSVIEDYYWQLVHNSMVCGTQTVFLSVFFGSGGWDYTEFNVSADEQYRLLTAEIAFWELVKSGIEPVDPPAPVRRNVDLSVMKEIDMGTNNEWVHNAHVYKENVDKAAAFEEAKETLRNLMPKDFRRAYGGGVEISRSRDNKLRIRVIENAS